MDEQEGDKDVLTDYGFVCLLKQPCGSLRDNLVPERSLNICFLPKISLGRSSTAIRHDAQEVQLFIARIDNEKQNRIVKKKKRVHCYNELFCLFYGNLNDFFISGIKKIICVTRW